MWQKKTYTWKKFKTDNKEYVKRERKLIFNEFVKWAMTYM